jgi:hypothetical protein
MNIDLQQHYQNYGSAEQGNKSKFLVEIKKIYAAKKKSNYIVQEE